MFRPVPLLVAALLGSAAALPARAQNIDKPTIAAPAGDTSEYGTFLVGKEALGSGDSRTAAAYFGRLASAHPDQPDLREHAFVAALFAGDVTTAARYAPADGDPPTVALGRLTRAAEAMAAGRANEADKLIGDVATTAAPHQLAVALLKPWTAAATGNWSVALGASPADGDRLARLFIQLERAQLQESRGRIAEAEAGYRALAEGPIGGALFKLPYGEFLERQARPEEAAKIYAQALSADPRDGALAAAQERVKRRRPPPPVLTPREGAAQALSQTAALMAAQGQNELALAYLRLAVRLDPSRDDAWVMTGDALAANRDRAGAREAWSRIAPSSRFYVEARGRLAYSLQAEGDVEGAVKLARETAAGSNQPAAAQMTLADVLRQADRDAEALTVLDGLVQGAGRDDWRVHYMRAVVLDKLNRWPDSEVELKRALELNPDEPDVQNYLGYSWIDRGGDVVQGVALVRKAVAARPNSGAMLESLGWAQFKLGAYDDAVVTLERAVEREPSDPSINDHLGDAYWMAGRKDEAGFQWRRALSFSPDAKLKAAIEPKLKDGLRIQAGTKGR